MHRTSHHIQRLQELRLLRDEQDAAEFERILAQVVTDSDFTVDDLWTIYDDDCEMHEVMFGLVHVIESRPAEEVIPSLVRHYQTMADHGARDWAKRHLVGVLNDDQWRNALVEHLVRAREDDVVSLRSALDSIAAGRPPAAGHAASVLASLENETSTGGLAGGPDGVGV